MIAVDFSMNIKGLCGNNKELCKKRLSGEIQTRNTQKQGVKYLCDALVDEVSPVFPGPTLFVVVSRGC